MRTVTGSHLPTSTAPGRSLQSGGYLLSKGEDRRILTRDKVEGEGHGDIVEILILCPAPGYSTRT